ncbi:GNAT family N-acetyltransferase [Proteobacteria bacterium 005FR1]|nr:GNAT family N-acetyltransferase [Proteobacteria bacterium 005FR1]
MNSYLIVPARPDHLDVLPAIERAAASNFPDALIPPDAREEVVARAVLEAACSEHRLWIAELANGDPVGFSVALPEHDSAFLLEVDVHPGHQGRGIGRALISAAVNWARREGFRSVTLTTFENPTWNAPFYERLGFRRLKGFEITPVLASKLAQEQAKGLKDRVAMMFELGS